MTTGGQGMVGESNGLASSIVRERAGEPARGSAPMRTWRWHERAVRLGKGAVGVAAAIGAWQVLVVSGILPEKYAPTIGPIVGAAVRDLVNGSLLRPVGETVLAWAIGLAIASAIGVALGALIGVSRWAAAVLGVLVRFLRPVPSVALIPIAILVAGLALKMTLILVVFASVWPILFNTAYGIREVPQLYKDTARTMGARPRRVLTRVTLPAALPSIFTGVRVSAAIALVVAVAAELITGSSGIGRFILQEREGADYPDAYAAVLVGGVLGYLINWIAMGAERRLLFWSAEHRSATT